MYRRLEALSLPICRRKGARTPSTIMALQPRMRFAMATMSLGRASAGHTMPTKLEEAARVGIEGIEVASPSLASLAALALSAASRSSGNASANMQRPCRTRPSATDCERQPGTQPVSLASWV
jgi:hypothetical protein